jgi:hypothetical protein
VAHLKSCGQAELLEFLIALERLNTGACDCLNFSNIVLFDLILYRNFVDVSFVAHLRRLVVVNRLSLNRRSGYQQRLITTIHKT